MSDKEDLTSPAFVGVPGLDDVLGGGLSRSAIFLLEGDPGTGTFETIILEGDGVMQTTEVVAEDEVEQQLRAIADRIEAQKLHFDEEDEAALAALQLAVGGNGVGALSDS